MEKFMELIAFAFLVAIANVGIYSVALETTESTATAAAADSNGTVLTEYLTSNSSLVNSTLTNSTVRCNSNDNCTRANGSSVNTTQLLRNLSRNAIAVPVGVNLSSICSSNETRNIVVYCDGSRLNLTQLCGGTNGTNVAIHCVNVTQTWVSEPTATSAKSNFTTSTNTSNGNSTLVLNSTVTSQTVSVIIATQNLAATSVLVTVSSTVEIAVSKVASVGRIVPSSSSSVEVSVSSSTAPVSQKPQESTAITTKNSPTTVESTTIKSTAMKTTEASTAETTTVQPTTLTTMKSTTKLTTTVKSTTKLTTPTTTEVKTEDTTLKTTKMTTEKQAETSALKSPESTTKEPMTTEEITGKTTAKPTFESPEAKNAKDVKFFYVNVLIPIGAGVCGALAIALAVVMFRCCRRRKLKKVRYFGKPTKHMMYMDSMNLLDNSSDEE